MTVSGRGAAVDLENNGPTEFTTHIVKTGDIPAAEVDSLWSRAGMYFGRHRLEWAWEDTRWDDLLVAVRRSGQLVGLLPVSIPRLAHWPDRLYDMNFLTGDTCYLAANACLLGGRSDVRASMLFCGSLSRDLRGLVAVRAVRAALDFAEARHLRCAAAYVTAEEEELSVGLAGAGMKAHPAPQRSMVRWPEPTITSYLQYLSASHREIVRRDWRKRNAVGLSNHVMEWADAIEPAAPLISAGLMRHGFQAHPKLVAMRLRRWRTILGDRAFALRAEAAGVCTGYVFGWHDQAFTAVYEIGFQRKSAALDHATYLDLLIYGPLEAACSQGVSMLDLGLYANEPKRLRGATVRPSYHWV